MSVLRGRRQAVTVSLTCHLVEIIFMCKHIAFIFCPYYSYIYKCYDPERCWQMFILQTVVDRNEIRGVF